MNQASKVVEVFKTDINRKKVARTLIKSLSTHFPDYKVNIDLADCDKVLRVESKDLFDAAQIVKFMEEQNVRIEHL